MEGQDNISEITTLCIKVKTLESELNDLIKRIEYVRGRYSDRRTGEDGLDGPIDYFVFKETEAEFKLRAVEHGTTTATESPSWTSIPPPKTNLIQISHVKGLIFFPNAEKGALAFAPIKNLAEKDYLPSEPLAFPGDESFIQAMCLDPTERYLFVAKGSNKLYAVDLSVHESGLIKKKPFICKITQLESIVVDCTVSSLTGLWVVTENGNLKNYSISDNSLLQESSNSTTFNIKSSFSCLSPIRNEILAIGSKDNNEILILNLKEDSPFNTAKTVTLPASLSGRGISSLFLLPDTPDSLLFSCYTQDENDDVSLNLLKDFYSSTPQISVYFDPCASRPPRPNQFYFQSLPQKWSDDLIDLVLVGNYASPDIGICGRLGPEEEFQSFFIDNDEGLAQLPLLPGGVLTYPLGVSVDLTSQKELKNHLDPEGEPFPAAPILWILTTSAHLCPFSMIKTNEKKNWSFMRPLLEDLNLSPPRSLSNANANENETVGLQSKKDDYFASALIIESANSNSSSLSIISSEEEDEVSDDLETSNDSTVNISYSAAVASSSFTVPPLTPSKIPINQLASLQKSSESKTDLEKESEEESETGESTGDDYSEEEDDDSDNYSETGTESDYCSEDYTEESNSDVDESEVEAVEPAVIKTTEIKSETKLFDFAQSKPEPPTVKQETNQNLFKFESPKVEPVQSVKSESVPSSSFKFDSTSSFSLRSPSLVNSPISTADKLSVSVSAPSPSASSSTLSTAASPSPSTATSTATSASTLSSLIKKVEKMESIDAGPYKNILLQEVANTYESMEEDLFLLKQLNFKNSLLLRQNSQKYFNSLEGLEAYATKLEKLLGSADKVFLTLNTRLGELGHSLRDLQDRAQQAKISWQRIKFDKKIDWNLRSQTLDRYAQELIERLDQIHELVSKPQYRDTVKGLIKSAEEKIQSLMVYISGLFLCDMETTTSTTRKSYDYYNTGNVHEIMNFASLNISSESLLNELSSLSIKTGGLAQETNDHINRNKNLLKAAKARGARLLVPRAVMQKSVETATITPTNITSSSSSSIEDSFINSFISAINLTEAVPEFNEQFKIDEINKTTSATGPSPALSDLKLAAPVKKVEKQPPVETFFKSPVFSASVPEVAKSLPLPTPVAPAPVPKVMATAESVKSAPTTTSSTSAAIDGFSFNSLNLNPTTPKTNFPGIFGVSKTAEEPVKEPVKPATSAGFSFASSVPSTFAFNGPAATAANNDQEKGKKSEEVPKPPTQQQQPMPSLFSRPSEPSTSASSVSNVSSNVPISSGFSFSSTLKPASTPAPFSSAPPAAFTSNFTTSPFSAPPAPPAFSISSAPVFPSATLSATPAFGQTTAFGPPKILPATATLPSSSFGSTSAFGSSVTSSSAPPSGGFAAFANQNTGNNNLGFSSFAQQQQQPSTSSTNPASSGAGLSFSSFLSPQKDQQESDKKAGLPYNFSGFRG